MKQFLATLTILITPFLFVAPQAQAQADTQGQVCSELPPGLQDECEGASDDTASNLASNILNILSLLVGVVSVIVLIIAGFMYVVSAGNPDTTKRAKNAILYALIGIVVAFSAQAIVRFVLSSI